MKVRIEVRDPLNGGMRALVTVRPVDLGKMERLVLARTSPSSIRECRSYALGLALGDGGRPGHAFNIV